MRLILAIPRGVLLKTKWDTYVNSQSHRRRPSWKRLPLFPSYWSFLPCQKSPSMLFSPEGNNISFGETNTKRIFFHLPFLKILVYKLLPCVYWFGCASWPSYNILYFFVKNKGSNDWNASPALMINSNANLCMFPLNYVPY